MFEAYKIGIRISLINHAASGLLGLSRQFMRAEQSARELEARILSIKHQALKGGLSLGVGVAGGALPVDKAPGAKGRTTGGRGVGGFPLVKGPAEGCKGQPKPPPQSNR